jgi:DNA-binding transcriptional LysR family regulator
MDLIECIRSFHAVVEEGGFNAAARKLEYTSSAVTKKVQFLEKHLRTLLLERSTRHVRLTERGKYFYERTKKFINEWKEIQEGCESRQDKLEGSLHLSSTRWIGQNLLSGIICKYLKMNPQVSIQQSLYLKPIPMLTDEIDICVATSEYQVKTENQERIHIAQIKKKIYASKDYIKKYGEAKTLEELQEHRLLTLCIDGRYQETWEFENCSFKARGYYHVNDGESVYEALLAGIGIAYVPEMIAKTNTKDLAHILPEYQSKPINLDIIYHKKKYLSYLEEDFLDFLHAEMMLVF